MAANANGRIEIKPATLYGLLALVTLLSVVAGMATAWGAQNAKIVAHHADQSIHMTEKDVTANSPSRGEYEATLKGIDESLKTIQQRLSRIEDKVYGR